MAQAHTRHYPRKRLLALAGVPLLLALLAMFSDGLLWLWQAGLGFALVLSIADLWLVRGMPTPKVQRQVHANLAQGSRQQVTLRVHNPGRSSLAIGLHDHHPQDFHVEGLPAQLLLQERERASVSYTVVPHVRGDHEFGQTDISLRSPLGLWSRVQRIDNPLPVRVFPNFGELSHFALLAQRNRLSDAGVRRRQRRGAGSDFHQLREYQEGDDLRQIDWKATGRYRRLISREYQDEQNQQLFFLLDCGQRMRHSDGQQQHLDAALNGMLLAAHVAAKQGDAVGFMTFAGDSRYVPPRKGGGTVPALLRAAYDVQSTPRAADYLRLADEFIAKHLRRALVVLITNTRDGDHEDLLMAVRLLQKKHLVIVADLRESALENALEERIQTQADALRFHTASALRESREATHTAMRHKGVVVLDLMPEQLPLALINEYFEVKRAGSL